MPSRIGMVMLGVGALLAVALVTKSRMRPAATGEHAVLAFTLKDMNGRDVTLSEFAGKPLVVNFWATWCPPCRVEVPDLVALSAKYRDRGLTIVGVSLDDSPDALRAFAGEFHVTYPLLVGLGHDDLFNAFQLGEAIPMSVLIRADGTVFGRLEGIATQDWWERQIQALF
jgi:peroxiredoxin